MCEQSPHLRPSGSAPNVFTIGFAMASSSCCSLSFIAFHMSCCSARSISLPPLGGGAGGDRRACARVEQHLARSWVGQLPVIRSQRVVNVEIEARPGHL